MGTKIDTGRNAIGYAASGRAIALLCVPALALSAQAALGQTETGVNEQTTIDRDRVDRRAPQVSLPPAGAEAPQGSVEVAPGVGDGPPDTVQVQQAVAVGIDVGPAYQADGTALARLGTGLAGLVADAAPALSDSPQCPGTGSRRIVRRSVAV